MTDELTPSLAPAAAPRQPFNVKCGACKHVWTAAWLPMEASLFGKVAKAIHCPACGNGPKGIHVAPDEPVSTQPPQRTA